MDLRLFGNALAVQAAWVFVLFAMLIALPLPEHFFEDAGFATGPTAWAICSFATARILSLRATTALGATLVGGLAGIVAFVAINHSAGMIAALLAFAACCGLSHVRGSVDDDRGDGIRTRDPRRERPVS
jgi:hypothetical protein